MPKKIAMMQPTFLPWLGYFELIMNVDEFIILDDFQFSYQSFGQRNRLFTSKYNVGWLTVPVDKRECFLKPYNEISIREDLNWRNKMWRCIEYNYSKAEFFREYAEMIQPLIVEPQYNLARQNVSIILILCELFGINTHISYSSKLKIEGKRSNRIKNIIGAVQGNIYLCAHGAFGYMYEDGVFPIKTIKSVFQNAIPKPYTQVGSPSKFIPYLSALDALFNVGGDSTRDIISRMTERWLTWDQMKKKIKERV